MLERLRRPVTTLSIVTVAALGEVGCTSNTAPDPEKTETPTEQICEGLPEYRKVTWSKDGDIFQTKEGTTCATPIYDPATGQEVGKVYPDTEFLACAEPDKPLRFKIFTVTMKKFGPEGMVNLSDAAAEQWNDKRDVEICEPPIDTPPPPPSGDPIPAPSSLPPSVEV